jgi:hypothetical protein|tara:strand:- start:1111 stop:1293 length:183 start_codon:yes stop_codon:yes gene_type:complete
MRKYTKKPWTMEERGVLSKYYYLTPLEELIPLLPGRTPNAIRKQVLYLRKRGWPFKREGK